MIEICTKETTPIKPNIYHYYFCRVYYNCNCLETYVVWKIWHEV